MNPDRVFSKDYQSKPYWWERTPRPSLETIELPKETEVLVVGSGYNGLMLIDLFFCLLRLEEKKQDKH